MITTTRRKLIREGNYLGEVEVELTCGEDAWAPYLSRSEAQKLDDLRRFLRDGDLKSAAMIGRIYRLTPVITA